MAQLVEFATNNVWLVLALLTSWAAVMFYELRLKSQTVSQISAQDAVSIMERGATIVDVREPNAFDTGHIVNSKNIALESLESDKNPLKKKNKLLLTVCEDGSSSGRAASSLRKAGFEKAFSLKGGLKQWRTDNMPLVK